MPITSSPMIGEPDLGLVADVLALNAHTNLSAARTALSGRQEAVCPLIRTSLESGCYIYLTAKTFELGSVSIERHKDEDARRLITPVSEQAPA